MNPPVYASTSIISPAKYKPETIFDSIVYALYGEVSSSAKDKSGLMLVSQFADKNVSPYVELTFENNGETYVVRREPRHHTYNKSGKQNATDANEKVTLRMPDGNWQD